MRKLTIFAAAAGMACAAGAWAGAADASSKTDCAAWPWTDLRAPCGASFRGVARNGGEKDKWPEFEIVRAGEWQREHRVGPRERLTYANYTSAAVIEVGDDEKGQPTFSITRDLGPPGDELSKTAETISYLNENCTVWVTAEPSDRWGMEHQDCITEDGVPLLRDYAGRGKGSLSQKLALGSSFRARMIRFQRAAVGQAEVRPPVSLFRWSRWGVVAGSAEGSETSYEVRLEDRGNELGVRPASLIIIHRLGQTELMVKRTGGNVQKMTYHSPTRVAEYFSFDSGNPRTLSIHSTSGTKAEDEARRAEKVSPPEPLGKRETILGEECLWYDMAPGWADMSHEECRTSDGISLARHETSRRFYSLVARATFLRRGAVRPKDLVPPQDLISAKLWTRAYQRD